MHPFEDITLTTMKRAVSLIGDTPDTLYSKRWAANPRPFDHRSEGMGCIHRWTEWPKCSLLGSVNLARSISSVPFRSAEVPAKTL